MSSPLDMPPDAAPDVSVPDASADDMSAEADAGEDEPDLGVDMNPVVDMDMGMPDEDAGMDIMCTTGSRDGVCLPTAECGPGMQSVPGFCPGAADIQCCVVASAECDEAPTVANMPQPNAGLVEAPGAGGCPSGMIPAGTFCVDRFEASLLEVLGDGSERPWSPYFNPGNRRIRAVSIEGAVPQAYINGLQAEAACVGAGKRLCSDTEWLRACRGAADAVYPYGSTRDPGVCNDSRARHPAIDYFDTTDDSIWSMLGNACIGQQDDTVDRAGQNAQCVSADGAFDMMGNLHEWTSAPSGTFRGGFYADTRINGEGCLYRTTAHGRSHWDYSTGFRCCADR